MPGIPGAAMFPGTAKKIQVSEAGYRGAHPDPVSWRTALEAVVQLWHGRFRRGDDAGDGWALPPCLSPCPGNRREEEEGLLLRVSHDDTKDVRVGKGWVCRRRLREPTSVFGRGWRTLIAQMTQGHAGGGLANVRPLATWVFSRGTVPYTR